MYRILDKIDSPKDIKNLTISELKTLCDEIRDYILKCCSVNPGHLGSSLGSVELIVGLHYIYNTPTDKLIFDVGHQAYAHKILTGRKEIFHQNRKKDGISGFPKINESEYDAFGAGHASTSISAALGFATAAYIKGIDEKVVAIIGDGSMTGGLAMEGLNNAGASKSDILIILNDNNQSIDNNTGAFHEYFLKITTDPTYNRIKSGVWNRLGDNKLRSFLQKITKDTKSNIVSKSGGALFEALGFRYFGPIDGNNIEQVVDTLGKLSKLKGPRILHTLTVKGKGYALAEQDPITWHAPGKFNPETGERQSVKNYADRYQDVFGQVLLDIAKSDPYVVGITPAMSTGCGMTTLAKEMPERFFDVGIAEEHAVTFSGGIAANGLKPFCNIYSSFSQRAYDQIIHDVALQNLPVRFCFDRGGLVGEDGATHQGCYDMAAYRSIPNIVISSPKDEMQLKNLMYSALAFNSGPYIIRYPRGCGEGVQWRDEQPVTLETGKGEKLADGSQICILAIGPVSNRAVEAAKMFKEKFGFSPTVYNMIFIKPIDLSILEEAGKNHKVLLTIEDGCLKGGLYGAVSEHFAPCTDRPVIEGIGVPDKFIEQDSQKNQWAECGLDSEGIYNKLILIVEKYKKVLQNQN